MDRSLEFFGWMIGWMVGCLVGIWMRILGDSQRFSQADLSTLAAFAAIFECVPGPGLRFETF
jgi:hypothetical protein